jgi:hypothetical protein
VKGADLTVLTSPLDKLAQLQTLQSQLIDRGSHAKELDDLKKALKG